MTLFFVEYRFLPYILFTTLKIGLITDFETRILLITDFWLELLLITDFGGTPLRPSFLWRSKESYNELITRISIGGNKDVCHTCQLSEIFMGETAREARFLAIFCTTSRAEKSNLKFSWGRLFCMP